MAESAQAVDPVIEQIARYAVDTEALDADSLETARMAVLDTMGCALAALAYPACTKLLGPVIPGTVVPQGARVPGTPYVLDPVQAAFQFGAALRWLDFNDTWLAAEWGHPSDNLGAVLPLADCLAQGGLAHVVGPRPAPTMRVVLDAITRAYEIQGVLALANSLNRRGLDHVLFVKVASAAMAARLLGSNQAQAESAITNAFVDNAPLRTYRHAPNTGSRKSWAAAHASSNGALFALLAYQGEGGYATALSAPNWGFEDVAMGGRKIELARPLASYVMRNVLFKVDYPAEFHAQTALEAAISLNGQVGHRWREVTRIVISTHESAIRIIDKRGPLRNPADRDHCIQYIVAVGLLKGTLESADYEDRAAADERIDWLRDRAEVTENPVYSRDYLDPDKRSAASSVTVFFADGTSTETAAVEYPIGHPRRRAEAKPKLVEKFIRNSQTVFGLDRASELAELWQTDEWVDWPVHRFVDRFVR